MPIKDFIYIQDNNIITMPTTMMVNIVVFPAIVKSSLLTILLMLDTGIKAKIAVSINIVPITIIIFFRAKNIVKSLTIPFI